MSIPTSIRTGGETDAFCTKCNLDLGHTILAMVGPKIVKVKCNTCGADHAFRGVQPLPAARPKAAVTGVMAPKVVVVPTWDEHMKGRNVTTARNYSVKDHFRANDLILHPTFGLGVVTGLRSMKIDVSFRDAARTLVNGRE